MSWKLDDDETFHSTRKPKGRGDATQANKGSVKRRLKDARGHKKKAWRKPRGRRFTRAAAIVAALCALVFAASASAGATRATALEAKLPTRDVNVYCVDTGNIGLFGHADFERREVFLQQRLCNVLLHQRSSYLWPLAVLVLYHEWWHVAFQEENEKATDCGALTILRYVLRTSWHLSRRQAQSVYDVAFAAAIYPPLPCKRTKHDPLLVTS